MSDEQKNGTGSAPKSKLEELLDKTKAFADKAEDFVEEKVEQIKQSGTYEKATVMADKVSDYVEGKVGDFQSSEMGAKFENFKEKAGGQAEDLYEKTKSVVNLVVDDVEEAIDQIKEKINKKGDAPKNG